jgi:hypothetical protein
MFRGRHGLSGGEIMRATRIGRSSILLAVGLMLTGCPSKAPEAVWRDVRVVEVPADLHPESDSVPAGSADYLDAKNGFRDLQFGTGVAPDMKLAEKQDAEETKSYVRTSDELEIGPAKAREIRYVYFDNGLTSVIIETPDLENSQALLDVIWAAYGANVNFRAPVQIWNGDNNVVHYNLEPTGEGRITIWNREMVDKVVKVAEANAAATQASSN